MPRTLKRFVAGALTSDAVSRVLTPLTRGVASILMMHRFADPERGNAGHDATTLRAHLAYLRRKRYDLVSLGELVTRLEQRDVKRLAKTVVFTIDDGYADYATVGAKAFEEFDCPATVFIVTGVTDDRGWYWWDRLRVALETGKRHSIALEIASNQLHLTWSDVPSAARAARAIVTELKRVPDGERRRILEGIPALVEAELPATPPPRYASMTWDEIRECGRRLTTFGAHTGTHPILARADDTVARGEIETSWRRLRAETSATVPVFCYPNGGETDFGPREWRVLREVGISGGVTSQPGYATVQGFHRDDDSRYVIPRFPYGGETTELVQVVNGVERIKQAVRGGGARQVDA